MIAAAVLWAVVPGDPRAALGALAVANCHPFRDRAPMRFPALFEALAGRSGTQFGVLDRPPHPSPPRLRRNLCRIRHTYGIHVAGREWIGKDEIAEFVDASWIVMDSSGHVCRLSRPASSSSSNVVCTAVVE